MEKKFLLSSITFILQLVGCLAGDELNVHIHFHGGDQAQFDSGVEEKPTSNQTTNKQCGQANRGNNGNRIVGGVETEKNEYPWQVLLIIETEYGPSLCSGSIISSQAVLTAGSCVLNSDGTVVSKENVRIWVGQHNVSQILSPPFESPEDYMPCEKPKVHGSFQNANFQNSSSNNYDFAILTLCEDLEFSQEVSPVCLPESAGQDPDLNEGVDTIITGWGLTSGGGNLATVLQEMTVQTKSNKDCIRDHPYYEQELSDSMLCGQAVGNTFCMGDSGGPWVTKVGSNYVLTGVGSWNRVYTPAAKDCPPGEPSIAARVTNQLNWIKSNMKGSTLPRA